MVGYAAKAGLFVHTYMQYIQALEAWLCVNCRQAVKNAH